MRAVHPTLAGISLRDLEYAAAVAHHRHFGQAAAHCRVSQPTLSEQVRKLEAQLGVTLFERTRKGVQITSRGKALLAKAERVLAEAHGLAEMARGIGGKLAGVLRLAAIQTLGPYYLPSQLRPIRAAYPELALRLAEGRTEPLLDKLRRGSIDLVLAALPLPRDGLTTVAVFREPLVLVCPKDHRLATLPRLSLPDLAAPDLLLMKQGHCLRDHALALCADATAETRHAASIETLWHMIATGEGYSLLPTLSLAGRDAMADLVTIRPLAEPEAARTIALTWRETDPRGDELRHLASLLRANLPDGVRISRGDEG